MHMHKPRLPHLQALIHVLKYIAHTNGQGILLQATDTLILQAYSNSEWGFFPNTRRSVTCYVLLLGNSPISWKSKKQGTISKSSREAKYRAMDATASKITWMVRLLADLHVTNLKPVVLNCDNQSAISILARILSSMRGQNI